jgi:hypothetical protein
MNTFKTAYPEHELRATIVHATYFGMTVTFIVLTVGILVRATFHRRITKNKLTMKPYYYMLGYFTCIVAKNFVLLTRNTKGEFPGLFMAWFYFMLDFGKTFSVLMSFGS